MRSLAHTSFCLALFGLSASPAVANDAINYQDHIRPIFQQSCFNCHNADKAKGGLDLTNYRATLAGGSSGEIVMSQSSDQSTLLGVMNHTLEPKMPPNGGKVADDKLKLIQQWIDQGLRETANSSANKPKKPRVDLSVGKAAVGRPDGPPIMPEDMPLGPIHQTPRPGAVSDVAGHPWSPIVAVTGQKQVLVYHTETSDLLGVLPFAYGQPQALRFSWTGKLLLVGGGVGGSSGTVVLYDVKTGQEVSRIGDEVDAVLAADLDPTQRFIALGGPSKRVKGYSVTTGELLYNLDKHTEWVTAIAFSPNGDYLASGDRNGGLHIWEADSGLHVFRLDGHTDSVTALSWRYDGKVLASSGDDGQARLWEMNNGKQVKNWGAHNGGAMSIAYAEDGRLVTTGRDHLVRVWDANGGKKFESKPFESLGLAASFDTTSTSVIAGDLTGKLVRWSLQGDGQQVAALSSNPPPIEIALSQSAEKVAAREMGLQQAKGQAQQQTLAATQAQKTAVDADAALNATRQAIKVGEQDVPKLDQARKQANQQRDAATKTLRDLQNKLRSTENALKGANNESNRAQQNYDKAVADHQKAFDELAKTTAQAEVADKQAKAMRALATKAKQDAQAAKANSDKAKRVSDEAKTKADQAKREADQARAAADQAKREADQAKARYDQAKREADQAKAQLDQTRQEADQALAQAEQAKQQADANPEDEGLRKRAEELAKQAKEKTDQAIRLDKTYQEKLKLSTEQQSSHQAAIAKLDQARRTSTSKQDQATVTHKAADASLKEAQASKKQADDRSRQADELHRKAADQERKLSDLNRRVQQQQNQANQRAATVKQRENDLAKSQDKTQAAAKAHEMQRVETDHAEQMAKERGNELDASNKAYEQARQDLNKAKQQLRPAEDKLKQATEAHAKAKALAEEAASTVSAAEQALVQTQRAVAKWQSAQLRLKIDALRRQRDELRGQAQQVTAQRDQKRAELKALEQQLASAQRTLAEQTEKLKGQDQAIAKAKQHVDKIAKQVDPSKPETAEALEDAQFDLETVVHASRKLKEAIAAQSKVVPAIKSEMDKARDELQKLEQAVAQQPKDLGAKQQAEIDALLPQYQKLREAAGF